MTLVTGQLERAKIFKSLAQRFRALSHTLPQAVFELLEREEGAHDAAWIATELKQEPPAIKKKALDILVKGGILTKTGSGKNATYGLTDSAHGASASKLQDDFEKRQLLYGALAAEMRLRVLVYVSQHPGTYYELIATALGTSSGNIAHHAGILSEAGIFASSSGTKETYCSIADTDSARWAVGILQEAGLIAS
jgi:DNA-binding transcriptional ArsR family regulator